MAVVSVVWVSVLTSGDGIFGWLPGIYYKIAGSKYPWLEQILFGCAKCNAGQIALWTYPLLCSGYSPNEHFFAVIFAIFAAKVLERYS